MTINEVIHRVRAYAKAQGFTKTGFAKRAKVMDTTLRYFHEKRWNPTAETLRRLEAIIPKSFKA